MRLLEKLDHPILFLIFIMLALKGLESLLTWGAKSAGLSGLASIVQHP